MKKFYAIIGILALLWSGCQKDSTIEDSQHTAFKSFLSGKDYIEIGGVYRYVTNKSRPGYESAQLLDIGAEAKIDFAVYKFASGTTGTGELYYTNQAKLLEGDTVLNPKYWVLEPATISLGDSRLVPGVRIGLEGCHQGDSVQLFVVSPLGYGDKPRGVVPDNTPLVWNIVVNEVIK